jgi:hypothetical protein
MNKHIIVHWILFSRMLFCEGGEQSTTRNAQGAHEMFLGDARYETNRLRIILRINYTIDHSVHSTT